MKQRTVKRAVEAWHWIHNNPHHIVGTEWKRQADGPQIRTHLYLQNYHEKMRIPEHLVGEVYAGIRPNRRKFDTRKYALTRTARLKVIR